MPLRLRKSISHRKGKTYCYYQLVRAVRRNGKATHEVVAHLGELAEAEAKALREGLASLKSESLHTKAEGEASREVWVQLKDVLGLGALRYLDLMVVRWLWEEWKLTEFFEQHIPSGDSEITPADVIFVLVANRCVAPCSKLRVTQWTPNTCLPRLLHFEPNQLNNTRLHRVLDAMEGIDTKLTRFLIEHPTRRSRLDSVVFLDLTNTWFEGHGGTLAQRSKTKDGAIRRYVVQIALGVDAHGLPLQWEVLPGKTAEVNVLPDWVKSLAQHEILSDLPLVFDRGLTSQENLLLLVENHRRFVTCARESQVERWKLKVDCHALARLPLATTPDSKTLESAQLVPTDDEDIYHVDLGIVRPPLGMPKLKEQGLRVVPYFRPSLFVRNRDSLERLCQNVEGKVVAINDELRSAKKTRSKQAVLNRIDQLLGHFQVRDEYLVHLLPIELEHKTKACRDGNVPVGKKEKPDQPDKSTPRKPIGSFQVTIERVAEPTSRQLNAGWMVILAHPDDKRPALDIIRQYHHKEIVEHAFGIIKSVVDLRPIHHHTNQKIKAHVTLCILGLLLNRYLELKLHEAGIHDAVDRVYEALEPCRLHLLTDRSRRGTHLTITEASSEQLRLLEPLGLSHLVAQNTTKSFAAPA